MKIAIFKNDEHVSTQTVVVPGGIEWPASKRDVFNIAIETAVEDGDINEDDKNLVECRFIEE